MVVKNAQRSGSGNMNEKQKIAADAWCGIHHCGWPCEARLTMIALAFAKLIERAGKITTKGEE